MTTEVWKAIPNFEGLYEASDLGRIRNARTLRVLKPRTDPDDYLMVTVWKGSPVKQVELKVHRAVLMAFRGVSELKADHINRVRSDNRLENLRWATDSLNSRNRTPRNGDVSSIRFRQDKKNPWQAYCHLNGKFRSLGHFATYDDARTARLGYERIFGHGNFAQ